MGILDQILAVLSPQQQPGMPENEVVGSAVPPQGWNGQHTPMVPPRRVGPGAAAIEEDMGGGSAPGLFERLTQGAYEPGSLGSKFRDLLSSGGARANTPSDEPKLPVYNMPQPSPQGTVAGTMPEPSSDPRHRAMFDDPPAPQRPAALPRPPMAAGVGSASGITTASPTPVPRATLMQQQAAQPAQPQMDGGQQFQSFIRALMTGAAGVNPQAPMMTAFMQGGAGAANVLQREDQQRQAAAAARAKQQFDDTLAIRKDGREERGAGRADEKLELERTAEIRKAQETAVKNQVAVDKIMRVRADGTLPVEARFKLQDQLNRYADKVNKNGLMRPEELDAALRKEQARLEEYYGVRKPDQPAAAKPAAGLGATKDAPARPGSKADFDALPSGAFYTNPADGKIYQKK